MLLKNETLRSDLVGNTEEAGELRSRYALLFDFLRTASFLDKS